MEQKRIPISLKQSTPSTVTARSLREQLHQIGLHCEETSAENLQRYMDDILDGIPYGRMQGFGMQKPTNVSGKTVTAADFLPVTSIKNNWEPDGNVPYAKQLTLIGLARNFDTLLESYPGFQGKHDEKQFRERGCTTDIFKQLFVEIAESISDTLVNGLDRQQMEAVFATIIEPFNPGSDDYDSGLQNRIILLVDDYNAHSHTCDGVGVLNLEFQIAVHNYRDKTREYKDYSLDITVRTSLYQDADKLNAEAEYLEKHSETKKG